MRGDVGGWGVEGGRKNMATGEMRGGKSVAAIQEEEVEVYDHDEKDEERGVADGGRRVFERSWV